MGEILISGLGSGAAYALFGLAIVIVYRSGGVFNIAITAVGAVGAYISYVALAGSGIPWALAIVLGMLAGGVVNSAIYVLIVRLIPAGGIIFRSVATLGCLLIIEGTITEVWGFQTYGAHPLTLGNIGGSNAPYVTALIFLALVATAVYVYYEVLPIGRVTRAIDQGPMTASLLGVVSNRWQALSWFLSGTVGTLGALVLASSTGLSSSGFDAIFATGIIGVAIGGFDSFIGVVVGGLLLGLVGDVAIRYLPTAYEQPIIFAIAVLVLLLRPNGLIGKVRKTVPEFKRESRSRRFSGGGSLRLPGVKRETSTVMVFMVCLAVVALVAIHGGNYSFILSCEFAGAMIPAILGMVVSTGYAGLFNVAPAAFSAISAYGVAILAEHFALPFLVILVLAVAISVVVGFLIGILLGRVEILPFGIVTIAFSAGIGALAINLTGLTGGNDGLLINSPSIFGVEILSSTSLLTFEFICVAVAIACVIRVRYSHTGRAWLQMKDDEPAARALGIPVARYKGYAMAMSAGLCGLSGVLLAIYIGVVTPNQLGMVQSLNIVVAFVIGGQLSIIGAIFGSIYLAVITVNLAGISYGTTLISGGVLIVIMLCVPTGLGPLVERLIGSVVRLGKRGDASPRSRPATNPEPILVESSSESVGVSEVGLS